MSEPLKAEAPRIEVPQARVKRKPVASQANWIGLPPTLAATDVSASPTFAVDERASTSSATTLADGVQELELDDYFSPPLPIRPTETGLTGSTLAADSIDPETPPKGNTPIISSSSSSKLARAWEETKYHAGGLISHPSESTKHYSVLRHSHGIVYYQGSETSVAVSVFADKPLPAGRKIWLQQKGWTGHTGMKAKALFGANGGWLDVTPSIEATAEQLPGSCERAWQRDIQKFSRKEGLKRGHTLRETCIIRIPCEAEDGYFRIVICGDGRSKNKLCPSPVFRVISLSTSLGSIKGASLRTLPLEVGIKIFTTVANNAMTAAAQPAASTLQKMTGSVMPSFWEREAISVAYQATGIADKIGSTNATYQDLRDASYQRAKGVDGIVYEALDYAPVIGDDEGPQPPFPVELSSTIIPGSGACAKQGNSMPTANLRHVKEEVASSLQGLYFGWARITPDRALARQLNDHSSGFFPIWHPSIIFVSTVHGGPLSVSYGAKKAVAAYLIHDFEDLRMNGSKIEIMVMGILRERISPPRVIGNTDEYIEQDSKDHIADIAIAQASLARSAWSIEAVYSRRERKLTEGEATEEGRIKKLTGSMTERYIDARQAAQRQIDRIPVHRVGLRRHIDTLREQSLGAGGICVKR